MAKQQSEKISFQQIATDIRAKRFSPLYFFYGEEAYFIDKLTDLLEVSVMTEAEKAFNATVFYGRDTEPQRIIESARRLPMMSHHTFVLVKEAQGIKDWELIHKYIQKPVPTTVLVFAYKNGKPDGRKAVFKDMAKAAVFFESKPLYENQLAPFAEKLFKDAGLKIAPEALSLFIEATGNEISRIENEVSKLSLNRTKDSIISAKDVEAQVGKLREFTVFELQNVLGQRDASRAFRIASYFKSNPKSAPLVLLLVTLHGYFTKLYLTHFHASASDSELAAIIGGSPYFMKDYKQAARHYPPERLEKMFHLLAEYDARSKGVGNHNTSEGELTRELIFRIFKN